VCQAVGLGSRAAWRGLAGAVADASGLEPGQRRSSGGFRLTWALAVGERPIRQGVDPALGRLRDMAVPHPTPHIPLAEVIVNALADDPTCLERLRELLGPAQDETAPGAPPAYTVAGLAQALGVTCRVVRNAIARGELPAVKRGARWYVTAEAVAAWTTAETALPARRPRAARSAARRPLSDTLARLDAA